jgi:type IV secretion system protein TrbL
MGAAGAALGAGGVGAAGGALAVTARAGASVAGGATAAYRAGGLSGVAEAGVSAATSPLRRAASSLRDSFAAGGRAVTGEAGASGPGASAPGESSGPPDWARRMKRSQTINRGASAADHAIRSGDRPSGGGGVDLSEGE